MRALPRPRTMLLTAAFIVLLALGVALMKGPPKQRRRLPDGTVVTLEGVTFGKGAHHLVLGNPVQRWLGSVLPLGAVRLLGITVANSATPMYSTVEEPDRVVFWLTWSGETAERFPCSWAAVFNERGELFHGAIGTGQNLSTGPLLTSEFPLFPGYPRGTRYGLVLYGRDPHPDFEHPTAEFVPSAAQR
jgi:hypothetical protein